MGKKRVINEMKSFVKYKILIVEDDEELLDLLVKCLTKENFKVIKAKDGKKALNLFYQENPDILVLDLNLPDLKGIEICRIIRKEEEYDDVAIMIISGNISDADKIEGLSVGADDYIEKPFNTKELVIRIRNILRRVYPPIKEEAILRDNELTINVRAKSVKIKDEFVKFTNKELSVLYTLVKKPGMVISRHYLLNKFWGFRYGSGTITRTVDTHINRIRKKLGSMGNNIKAVKGEGYMYIPKIVVDNRKKKERNRLENMVRLMLQTMEEAIILTDKKGRIIMMNSIAEILTGYNCKTLDEIGFNEVFNIIGSTGQKVENIISNTINRGEVSDDSGNIGLISKTGKRTTIKYKCILLNDANSVVLGVVVNFSDITCQKLAEYALSELEEVQKVIMEQALMGIVIIQDGMIKYINNRACNIIGASTEDIKTLKPNQFLDIIYPDDKKFAMEQASKKQTGEKEGIVTNYQFRIIDKNSKIKWIDHYSKTIIYGNRPADMVLWLDITDKKSLEEALSKAL